VDALIPPCAAQMGCLCAGHARGDAADAPCNTDENECAGSNWGPCSGGITHLDEKGYVYCTDHGIQRRDRDMRCRKLLPSELRKRKRGELINYRRGG
jgi:hypothetical protein